MLNSTSYTCRVCLNLIKKNSNKSLLAHQNFGWSSSIQNISIQAYHTQTRKRLLSQYVQCRRISSASSNQDSNISNYINQGKNTTAHDVEEKPILTPDNLFHPFSSSPSAAIRRRASLIKKNAYCPHPDHHQTRIPLRPNDPEARKSQTGLLSPAHVEFECPDCGIPVSCSEHHWADDYEAHLEICETLRQINEDDHDLNSGRFFPEFSYPTYQIEEAMINMTSWDTILYTREFQAINNERSLRQVTKLLTYPITIGSILHELSPYNIKRGGRLTIEGLKSFSGMLLYCSTNQTELC